MIPDGAAEPVSGVVSQVSLLPTSDGASTYPVKVRVSDPDAALASGATASVELVLGTAEDVVTVPNSAITSTGAAGTGTVVVLTASGATERLRVTTGAVGATATEVTEGLDAGQAVVLADLDAPLPGGAATVTPGGFPGGGMQRGGFPGGGAPAGGFRGGAGAGPR